MPSTSSKRLMVFSPTPAKLAKSCTDSRSAARADLICCPVNIDIRYFDL
jgi:hypothetical protein